MSDPDDWRAWVAKATNDLLNIENNLGSAAVPWDTVCFHAQQAAEKAVKALLVARGEVVKWCRAHMIYLRCWVGAQPWVSRWTTLGLSDAIPSG